MSYNRYGDYDGEEEDDMEEEVEDDRLRTVPRSLVDLAQASVPPHLKALRACKRCGVIKTVEQFMNDGCENCPMLDMVSTRGENYTIPHKTNDASVKPIVITTFIMLYFVLFLSLNPTKVDNNERINLCTTAFFEGTVSVIDPRSSWVGKLIVFYSQRKKILQ
jgi:hypothetical protein